MCFFYFLENFSCNRPVIHFSGVFILIQLQSVFLCDTKFITDICSHSQTTKFNRFLLCREAEQNTIHGTYRCICLTKYILNGLSFRSIHILVHIDNTIHCNPTGSIAVINWHNIQLITTGNHQLNRLLIFCILQWKKFHFNMIFRNHVFIQCILHCGTCCVILLVELDEGKHEMIRIFFRVLTKLCFCYGSIYLARCRCC